MASGEEKKDQIPQAGPSFLEVPAPVPQPSWRVISKQFIAPEPFHFNELLAKAVDFQTVAGHPGFLISDPAHCLKPFSTECARGRREHFFYQMVKWFKRNPNRRDLYYKDFSLIIDPRKKCECKMDPDTFISIDKFLPNFEHVKHTIEEDDDFKENELKRQNYFYTLNNQSPHCPCYNTEHPLKDGCSLDYDQQDFLCIEDLQAHCEEPCVLDIKIGRVTHDPMAPPHKIIEQQNKYPRLRDFGFRILGMKSTVINRDKSFGRSLEAQEQVFEAIESFFLPLPASDFKCAVIGTMLNRLEDILEWFETMNNNQLRFYASSLLFIYDAKFCNEDLPRREICNKLARSTRVRLIDFAHVFHSHELQDGPSRSGSSASIRTSENLNKDDNYLYGLRRLVKFFIMLNRQQRVRLAAQPELTEGQK